MSGNILYGISSKLPSKDSTDFMLTIVPFDKPPQQTLEVIGKLNEVAKDLGIAIHGGDPDEQLEIELNKLNYEYNGHSLEMELALTISTFGSTIENGWESVPALRELMSHLEAYYDQI